MKIPIVLLISICTFFYLGCKKSSSDDPDIIPPHDVSKPVVYGCYPSWDMNGSYHVPWEKLTHLCLSCAYVNENGTIDISVVTRHRDLISEAHHQGVVILLSVFGGAGSYTFSTAILNTETRAKLVSNLTSAVKNYSLDGLDIDYEEFKGGPGGLGEGDLEKRTAIEGFFKELRQSLPKGKIITYDVSPSIDKGDGGWGTYNCHTNDCHKYVDYINIMIYGETGDWPSSKVGQHASMAYFTGSIDHWLNTRKVPPGKILAGVPFYGILFQSATSPSGAAAMTYKDIVNNYPNDNVEQKDQVGLLFYNGRPTIQSKAQYAKDHGLGGIMIWAISQDSPNQDKSLLPSISGILKN